MKKIIYLVCFLAACGSKTPNQESTLDVDIPDEGTSLSAAEIAEEDPATDAAAEPAPAPITSVSRAELDAIIKKGPGYALAAVQTDSVKQRGKFVGYKVVGFRLDASSVLGVQPGDVVHRINGISVEKPMALVEIFEKLKTASTVDFAITRGDDPMSLSTPVQ